MQHTLKSDIHCSGTGLHSGAAVHMCIRPAPEDTGIRFVRTDIKDGDNVIPARWDLVVDTRLCTMIANENGAAVGTIEHLMAALRGCGIDNAVIELDGPEVPVMDGSSAIFVDMITETGLDAQAAPRRVIRILKEVSIEEGDKKATLSPSEMMIFGGDIDFDHPSIGRQHYELELVNGNFCHDLADSRTFGFLHEVEWMRKNGLARGGSLENAIVLNDEGIMNPEGLRHNDEFIRHKLLDAIGDLYLAGGQILGAYDSSRSGHALNNALLHKLFATEGAWELVDWYGEESTVPSAGDESVKELALAV